MPIICRTPSSSIARPAPRSRRAIPAGSPRASTSSRRTRRRTARTCAFYATAARGAPAGRRALPLRGDGRRRPADHPDAARSARNGRRDPPDRGHPVRHAGLSVQRLGRRGAVLGRRARRPRRRATPSPTRATTCPAWTSRASSSSSAARWVCGSSSPTSQLESLVPPALAACGADEFLERLPEFDAPMAQASRGGARPQAGAALRRLARCRRRAGVRSGWSSSSARIPSRTSISPTTSCAS